jgi:hypothetical protein
LSVSTARRSPSLPCSGHFIVPECPATGSAPSARSHSVPLARTGRRHLMRRRRDCGGAERVLRDAAEAIRRDYLTAELGTLVIQGPARVLVDMSADAGLLVVG